MFESKIADALQQIERSEGVRVLYACESGSRAWGFASRDSDYDVRFIYANDPDWYLSIDLERRRDVIERPIEDDLDLSGWDLRKALQLLRKSNPPLLEWLGSPIIYHEDNDACRHLRELSLLYHSPPSCAYHYLHMARGNFRGYLRGEQVSRKKYLYVLRPLLAVRWIEWDLGIVPTEFRKLFKTIEPRPELVGAIEKLLKEKESGLEGDQSPRIEPISRFIETELERLKDFGAEKKSPPPPVEPYNQAFREILRSAWA